MRHLFLTENEPTRRFTLSDDEAAALDAAELAVVSQSPGSSEWDVAAGRRVGVARVGDLQVIVRPKISIDRLIFLMGYANDPGYWRERPVLLDADADLVEVLAHSFTRRAHKALEQGLLHGYVETEEALPTVRGRMRIGDQLARHRGVLLPVEVTYDDFSVNIAENQLLLEAILRLLRIPAIPRDVRRRLHRLRMQLADVQPLVRGRLLPTWRPSRLNTRYQPALALADLILAGNSFEQRIGDLHISGFAVDMWKVYEDFVCIALQEALAQHGGRSSLQYRLHLDEGRQVDMRPDFFWAHDDGRAVVLDAKYKAERPNGFPNADLYQLLAYCTVLGLSEGHLVYAKGNEESRAHDIVGAGVRIHCHTLDLSASPGELLGQVEVLADALTCRARGVESGAHPAGRGFR